MTDLDEPWTNLHLSKLGPLEVDGLPRCKPSNDFQLRWVWMSANKELCLEE